MSLTFPKLLPSRGRPLGVALALILSACAVDASDEQSLTESSREQPAVDAARAVLEAPSARPDVSVTDPSSAPSPAGDMQVTQPTTTALAVPDIVAITAQGKDGIPAAKGDPLELIFEITSSEATELAITPLIDSQRFHDFIAVPLGTIKTRLSPGTTRIKLRAGPFVSNEDGTQQFALGSGDYTVAAVRIDAPDGTTRAIDRDFTGARFRIAESNALLIPVVYDTQYLTQITGNPDHDAPSYLRAAFTRPAEVFSPLGSDPDGAGTSVVYPGGFDEMMNVRHLFRAFAGFPGARTTSEGYCEDAAAYAAQVLGMRARWDTQPPGTRPERHGFDYLIALTPEMGGGAACGWLDVQVSSFIERDLARQHVIVVHESSHIFGSPHCDDVGDGSGGPLQGYVMCSGEKHPHYPGHFVWHASSILRMRSHWK